MHRYGNADNSGVQNFEIGIDSITIRFSDGSIYLYNYEKPGKMATEKMKALALKGKGLATYINKYVRNNFALKLK